MGAEAAPISKTYSYYFASIRRQKVGAYVYTTEC